MNTIVGIFTLVCLILPIGSNPTLKFGHYENLTLNTCGWSMYTDKPAHNKCFVWHKTYKQLRKEHEFANIYNGRDAKLGEFPFTVLIEHRTKYDNKTEDVITCTGAIISAQWIITSAHCYYKKPIENLYIYIGYTKHPLHTEGFAPMKAVKFIESVWYSTFINTFVFGWDYALLKLANPIDFRTDNIEKVNTVCLPEPGFEILAGDDEIATLSGWGDVGKDEINDWGLRAVTMTLHDKRPNVHTFESKHSVGNSCPGDSGAPLVKYINGRAILIGTLEGKRTRFYGCVEDFQLMRFSSISNHVEWILKTIKEN